MPRKSTIAKIGVAGVVATGLLAGTYAAVVADGDRGGKHGKGMRGMHICAPDFAEKAAERRAELLETLNLTAEQQGLFNQIEAQRTASAEAAAPICEQMKAGDTSKRELKRELKKVMMQSRLDGMDAQDAFRDSLSDEQKKAMRKLRREAKKEGRKHGRYGSGSYED